MLYENLQIKEGDLPDVEEVEFHTHPKRYKRLRLINLILIFLILSIAWIAFLISGAPVEVWLTILGVWVVLFGVFLFEELKGFPVRGYALRAHDITYKKGFLRFTLTTIPFNRIQHSEISHGPIARLFKLSSLKIYTAGGSSSDLKISGLEPEKAKKLRDYIAKVSSEYA